jgi:hypothetical protein
MSKRGGHENFETISPLTDGLHVKLPLKNQAPHQSVLGREAGSVEIASFLV